MQASPKAGDCLKRPELVCRPVLHRSMTHFSVIRSQSDSAFIGHTVIMVDNYCLMHEVLHEKCFHKAIAGALKEICMLIGDGLLLPMSMSQAGALLISSSVSSTPCSDDA